MEILFILISIALLLYIIRQFASYSEKKRKEQILNDWRSRYTSKDYVPPTLNNASSKKEDTVDKKYESTNDTSIDNDENIDDDVFADDDFDEYDDDFDDDDEELYDGDELTDDDSDEDEPLDGMSFSFDSRYDYDLNDPLYDDEYGMKPEDDDDWYFISEDRESMHLRMSSFYSMRAGEEMVLWKNGLYYPKSAIHEMPKSGSKFLDDSAMPYKVPVRRRKKK